MKPSLFLVAATVVVLTANAWVCLSAYQNRQTTESTLQLSEQELTLVEQPGESTVRLFSFRWTTRHSTHRHQPGWLDQEKLTELGFNCSVPLAAQHARDYYRSLPDRPVWLALGLAEQSLPVDQNANEPPSRLCILDASQNASLLRTRYPDSNHCAITRGLIHLSYIDDEATHPNGPYTPRLQGRIITLLPETVFVPRHLGSSLKELRSHGSSPASPDQHSLPRYTATVAWGQNGMPWLDGVLLSTNTPSGTNAP